MATCELLTETPVSAPTESKRFTNVIRKLGNFEKYFHDEIEINGTINASTFLFTSSIDLFTNKDVVYQGINFWKQTQPFLCSRVIAPEKNNRYFVYTSEDKIKKADNVTFLHFKTDPTSEKIDDCKDYWKLLIERELTIPIDWKNGPMWRLMLIKLKTNDTVDKFEYCLISTATHAIFDGHSAFQALANLFTIIENVYNDKLRSENIQKAKVADPIEEIVTNHLEKVANIGNFNKLDGFKQPLNFLVKNLSQRKLYIPVDELNTENLELKGAFYSDVDQSEYITLKSLVDLSKESLTKMYFINFNGNKFKTFLAKCKLNNAKITGVINTMFVLAWRLVYANLNNENKMNELTAKLSSTSSDRHPILSNTDLSASRDQKISYSTIVNLRGHIKDIEHDSLVWLCNSLYSSFDSATDLSDPTFWNDTFWELSRNESDSFHNRLKKGEQFQIFEQQKTLEEGESRIHYGLSNLIVPKQATQHLNLFRIEQLYTTASYRQNWVNDLSYHNMININDNLCWILSYNSYFIKNEVIKVFVNSVMEIYDILCDS